MVVPKFEWIKMALWGKGDPRWIVEERPDSKNVNNWHWWVTLSFCLPYLWLYSISCTLDFFYKTLFRHNSLYITSSVRAYPNEKFLPVLEEQAQELPEWEVKNRKVLSKGEVKPKWKVHHRFFNIPVLESFVSNYSNGKAETSRSGSGANSTCTTVRNPSKHTSSRQFKNKK